MSQEIRIGVIGAVGKLTTILACVWLCGCQTRIEHSGTRDSATLDPRDFGARGDGVADDTEAFNRLDAWIALKKSGV